MGETRGFLYAATGADYTALAIQSAARLAQITPGAEIDLFTDQDVSQGLFAQIHRVEPWFRPKFEALRRTRFDRAIYLDADTWVVADISDIFELLDRFDFAMAHDPYRATDHALRVYKEAPPACYPQFNSGVIGQRRSPDTAALCQAVIDGIKAADLPQDQVILRELLYKSALRVATLPEEYNFMGLRGLNVLSSYSAAPRVIHSPRLHASFKKGKRAVTGLEDVLGAAAAKQLQRLVEADPTLGGHGGYVAPLMRRGGRDAIAWAQGLIRGRFSK